MYATISLIVAFVLTLFGIIMTLARINVGSGHIDANFFTGFAMGSIFIAIGLFWWPFSLAVETRTEYDQPCHVFKTNKVTHIVSSDGHHSYETTDQGVYLAPKSNIWLRVDTKRNSFDNDLSSEVTPEVLVDKPFPTQILLRYQDEIRTKLGRNRT